MRLSILAIAIGISAGMLLAGFSASRTQNHRYSYTVPHPVPRPQIFGEGVISVGDYDTHPAFSPDGETLYFLKCTVDIANCTICVSRFRNDRWTEPTVAPFSGQYLDADPFVSKDGKTLYFISNRPLKPGGPAKDDTDIWKVDVTPHGWGTPVRLDPPVNSERDEYYPTLADNGALYFGSTREGGKGGSDIYRCPFSDGKFAAAENLGDAINTADNEYEPFIAADESYLIFMATIPRGLNNGDLYFSKRVDGAWSKAEKLPAPFNSVATEWSPKVTRDGQYFFFSSARDTQTTAPAKPETMAQLTKRLRSAGNGLADIYQVDFSAVKAIMERTPASTGH
jgi:hypothetical protein